MPISHAICISTVAGPHDPTIDGEELPKSILVIGGTGPTGIEVVKLLTDAGDDVTVLHSGQHEPDLPPSVSHLHGDARSEVNLRSLLGHRTWDIAVCSYGNLRAQLACLTGRVGRLVGITGQPVYQGVLKPTPIGTIALPVAEDFPCGGPGGTLAGKIHDGESELLRLDRERLIDGVIVRYPGIYGPFAPPGHEWPIVKRLLDGRPRVVLPDGGITYFQRGYALNVAWLVYLAIQHTSVHGEVFNAGDERVIPLRRIVEIAAAELGRSIQAVDLPGNVCRGIMPLGDKSSLILDMSKPRIVLGYSDRIDVEEATRRTVRWLAENPVSDEALALDKRLHNSISIDYTSEDRLLEAWDRILPELEAVASRT